MHWRRVRGVVRRHSYGLKRSWPRIFDIFYWPLIEVLTWGLITEFLLRASGQPFSPAQFLGAMILWVVIYRAQEDIAVSFLEELWSQNQANTFASPVTLADYLSGLAIMSLVKTLISAAAMMLIAWSIYGFTFGTLGLALIPAVATLVLTGWGLGLFAVGLILRFGRRVDVVAWSLASLIQPISCAVYPLKVLPPTLQQVAALLPAVHVFEANRAALAPGGTDAALLWGELAVGFGLAVLYLGVVLLFVRWAFTYARRQGRLAVAEG